MYMKTTMKHPRATRTQEHKNFGCRSVQALLLKVGLTQINHFDN